MAPLDREAVRAASPIEQVIADLTGESIHGSNGSELKFRCPWHEDKAPSLRVNVTKQTWYCDPCAEGGDVFRFVERIRDCDFKAALAFLAERAGLNSHDADATSQIVVTYDYMLDGVLQYQTVRLQPKDFRQRRPDGNSGWIWDLKGTEPILYRHDELQGKRTVTIAEGEKDVDRLWGQGVPATTNHGGAKKWKSAHAEQLVAAGVKEIVVIGDNDAPGQQHAEIVARSCHDAGIRVKVLALPDLPPKGDVSDWLEAGHAAQELAALAKAVPVYVPPLAEIPASKTETIASGSVPSEPVDLAVLLDDTMKFVQRYVVMSVEQAIVVALWVAHTYVIAAFDVTPYLNVQSATPRAGKTRLFEVLQLIVLNAWFTARTSAAALIRKIDATAPTLLFDERDATFKGDPELAQVLRGLLNAGYRRGGTVSLCVGVGTTITVKDFNAFCPKAIGGIGQLPDTVGDQSIDVMLRRRIKEKEAIEKFKMRIARGQAIPLTHRLIAWAQTAAPAVRDANPIEINLDNDRAEEVWEPLLHIAALAGDDWLARARAAATVLSGSRDAEDVAVGIQLLTDIREVFHLAGDPDAMATKEIREALVAIEDRPWASFGRSEKPITPHRLTTMVAEFKVVAGGPMWIRGETVRGFRREAFADAWLRYCRSEALGRKDANNDGPDSVISGSLGSVNLTNTKTQLSPNKHSVPYDLTLQTLPEAKGQAESAGREVHPDYLWRDVEEVEGAADRDRFEL